MLATHLLTPDVVSAVMALMKQLRSGLIATEAQGGGELKIRWNEDEVRIIHAPYAGRPQKTRMTKHEFEVNYAWN